MSVNAKLSPGFTEPGTLSQAHPRVYRHMWTTESFQEHKGPLLDVLVSLLIRTVAHSDVSAS